MTFLSYLKNRGASMHFYVASGKKVELLYFINLSTKWVMVCRAAGRKIFIELPAATLSGAKTTRPVESQGRSDWIEQKKRMAPQNHPLNLVYLVFPILIRTLNDVDQMITEPGVSGRVPFCASGFQKARAASRFKQESRWTAKTAPASSPGQHNGSSPGRAFCGGRSRRCAASHQ